METPKALSRVSCSQTYIMLLYFWSSLVHSLWEVPSTDDSLIETGLWRWPLLYFSVQSNFITIQPGRKHSLCWHFSSGQGVHFVKIWKFWYSCLQMVFQNHEKGALDTLIEVRRTDCWAFERLLKAESSRKLGETLKTDVVSEEMEICSCIDDHTFTQLIC